jgi:hypothetical protein
MVPPNQGHISPLAASLSENPTALTFTKPIKMCHNCPDPRNEGHMVSIVFGAVVALLGMTGTAHAYIDPGAGSFVLQMALAGALALGATIKFFWFRIKQGARRLFLRRGDAPDRTA